MVGWLFEKFGVPGFVKPVRYYDGDTGTLVEVKTSRFYTKIVVGNTELFFNRESGKYDGFGVVPKEMCGEIEK